MKIDILVLNYNGRDLLEAFLPSVREAAGNSSHECRAHVVDNRSSDGSLEMLKERFPGVVTHLAPENRVLCSYNETVRELDSDIVIFLNNDIKVEPDFVDHLARHFRDEKVMFAAPRLMNFDNTYNGGRSYLKFSNGGIKVMVDSGRFMEPGATQAISTGAFRRKTFLDFGGFDDLYLPGIWEDVDICFRGQLAGYRGVYEPASLIWHAESTTFHREYGKRRKMRLAHRNMYLFFWKNITDPGMFARHVIFTPPKVIAQYIKGNRECLEGLLLALGRMPLALGKRRRLKERPTVKALSDRSIIT